ncbi:hypothetical protein SLEP1_g31062 [Rubroshorea leprosula]|uniref:Uncharacterized protein n=1 Tax=Rubroshorea leprosula TaxID=152421 RepID=A0AAV5K7C1_9ROSI|nr:hypothetical protein SLEP1_g31062 [Rubroshorea leprosula]
MASQQRSLLTPRCFQLQQQQVSQLSIHERQQQPPQLQQQRMGKPKIPSGISRS